MSRMPIKSIHFEFGQCDFCGAEDVETMPLWEITDDNADDNQWICCDCLEQEYPELMEEN